MACDSSLLDRIGLRLNVECEKVGNHERNERYDGPRVDMSMFSTCGPWLTLLGMKDKERWLNPSTSYERRSKAIMLERRCVQFSKAKGRMYDCV